MESMGHLVSVDDKISCLNLWHLMWVELLGLNVFDNNVISIYIVSFRFDRQFYGSLWKLWVSVSVCACLQWMYVHVCADGHSVATVKLSAVIVHNVHSCEQIQWNVCEDTHTLTYFTLMLLSVFKDIFKGCWQVFSEEALWQVLQNDAIQFMIKWIHRKLNNEY